MVLLIVGVALAVVAGLVHLAAYLMMIAYPVSSLSVLYELEEERKESDDVSSSVTQYKLTPNGGYLLRTISTFMLVLLVVAIASAVVTFGIIWLWLTVPLAVAVKVQINIYSALIYRRYTRQIRRIGEKLLGLFNAIGGNPLIEPLFSRSSPVSKSARTYYGDVEDLIKVGLSYITDINIPQEERELRMIRGILRMNEVRVREIMCPRPDVVAISKDASYAELTRQMRSSGISKLPVFDGSLDEIDNVSGIIFALDLIGTKTPDKWAELVRSPLLVTEFQSVEKLLLEFKEKRTSIALVVNEYGGMDGLVTVVDVLEEIVGEIMDEFDRDHPEIQKISDNELIVSANTSLDQINQLMNLELHDEEVGTIGGLVYTHLDKMPSMNDTVTLGALELSICNMLGRRVRRVKVTNNATS